MRRPYLFASLVVVVLAIAAGVVYQFGLPLLHDTSISCRAGGGRTLGCSTGFGMFLTMLVAGVAVAVGFLWSKFSDY